MTRLLYQFISRLPVSWVRSFSYFLLKNVTKYRSTIILENLELCFPELRSEELVKIRKDYYRVLSRYFSEIVAFNKSSKEEILKNYNFQISENYWSSIKGNTILMASHFGNWEVVIPLLPLFCPYRVIGVYKPLSNKRADEIIYNLRSKYGLELVPMEKVVRLFNDEEPKIFVFINDQSPSKGSNGSWIKFMGNDTLWYEGILKLKKKFSIDFSYLKIWPNHSTYDIKIENLDDAKPLHDYVEKLETNIHQNRAYWLWSHRRWKHKK